MTKKAIYPGSFDPMTKGHLDIIQKALNLFDEVYVVVAVNPNKKHMFSIEDRGEIATQSLKGLKIPEGKKIFIVKYEGIITKLGLEEDIDFIIRGMRNSHDMQDEYAIEQFTEKSSDKEIGTVYFSPSPEHIFTSSTLVRNFINAGFPDKVKEYVDQNAMDTILSKSQFNEKYAYKKPEITEIN